VQELVGEHQTNMSLLLYDFNGSLTRAQMKEKSRFTDLVIPEEAEEGQHNQQLLHP